MPIRKIQSYSYIPMPRLYLYYLSCAGFFGLFFLQMAWSTLLFPNPNFPTALALLIGAGPLLLPFKGFLNKNLKSCTWMTYLSLPYFIHGVAEAYASVDERLYAVLELSFSLLLCFGAGFYVYRAPKA